MEIKGTNRLLKIVYFTVSIAFILLSCEEKDNTFPGYSKHKKGFYYKLIQIGTSEEKAQIKDYITIDFHYSTMDDSIFFRGSRKLKMTAPDYEGSIDDCFAYMVEGDSISFILKALPFFKKTLNTSLPSFIDSSAYMKINIRMKEIQTFAEFQKQKEEFLAWIEDFGEYEKIFLKHYIEEQNIAEKPNKEGIYKILLREGKGNYPQKGDTITIQYEGKFLNGNFFDSSKQNNMLFEFVYGTEWQVIKGIETVLANMRQGEKSIFIMPSDLAFGAMGSSSGIVPPYTSVIYELELKKVAEGDSLSNNKLLIDADSVIFQ